MFSSTINLNHPGHGELRASINFIFWLAEGELKALLCSNLVTDNCNKMYESTFLP